MPLWFQLWYNLKSMVIKLTQFNFVKGIFAKFAKAWLTLIGRHFTNLWLNHCWPWLKKKASQEHDGQPWLKEYSVILTTSFCEMNQKLYSKTAYFQNFSWFQFNICLLCTILCIGIDYCVKLSLVGLVGETLYAKKNALISKGNSFSLIPFGKCAT